MMDVFPILPTPLGVIACPFHKDIKTLVLKELAVKSGSPHTNESGDFLYHLDYYSLLHDDKFKELKSWCEEQAKMFVKDVMGKYLQNGMIVTDSWINVCDKGGKQEAHTHVNSVITGVYYVNLNDTHANTYFVSREAMGSVGGMFATVPNISLPFETKTMYNQVGEMKCKEGDLVLFPSHVLHGYNTNQGNDRVTVAMNIMPETVCGWDYGWNVQPLTEEQKLELNEKRKSNQIFLHPDME